MNQETPNIAHGILEYLAEEPDAEDTLEGIVNWWLKERTIKQQTLSVKKALAILVEDGLVVAVKRGKSPTHYRINSKQRKKIIWLLNKKSFQ